MNKQLSSPVRPFKSLFMTCLLSCSITVLLLAVVYALRGIWPFGTGNIAYVDTAQFYLPDYYAIWDAMHGADWNVNWFSGLAEFTKASWSTVLKPCNWVFLLVSRDHVLESLSLYLAVQLFFIALAASLAIGLRFPGLQKEWKVLLALAYTFSGFVLQYYSNFFWLRIVALFPILLYCLELLLRTGKYIPFSLVYTYLLYAFSVYYVYMVTLYILLFSLSYCLFLLPRDQRNNRIFRLALSSLFAFGVTARGWLNQSSSMIASSRFQTNLDSGLLTGFTTWNITNTRHTALMLFGMAFTIALMGRALLRQHFADKENTRRRSVIHFFAFLLGLLAIPMVFTNIDTAWHFGQYNFFPMRYGYVLTATLLSAAALCLQEEAALPETIHTKNTHRWIPLAASGISAVLLVFLFPKLWSILQEYGACFLTSLGKAGYWRYFALLAGCGLLFTVLYMSLLQLKARRIGPALMIGVLLFQLGANTYALMAPSDDHTYTNEYNPAYVETSDSLYAYFSEQDISPLSRFKNIDNSLNAGYPSIAGVSALSSINSGNSNLRLGVFQELGYTTNYFRILDTGGTVFSDMLLGVQHILSAEEMDPTLYADTGVSVGGIRIGDCVYPGRIGLTFSDGALDDYLDILTLDGRLNALYQAFTDSSETLAYTPEITLTAEDSGIKSYALTCTLEEDSFLYLASSGMLMNITADGSPVIVPSYLNTKNTVYPAAFNANLLYTGCFGPGEAVIRFMSALELTEESFTVVALKKSLLDSFYDDALYDEDILVSTDQNSISISLSADSKGQNLFLPLTYRSWNCTVNGEPAALEHTLGVMISVPLEEGQNQVILALDHTPRLISRSDVFMLIYLAVAAALWAFFLRSGSKWCIRRVHPAIHSAAAVLFFIVCGAVIIFLYIVPTVYLITQGTVVRF